MFARLLRFCGSEQGGGCERAARRALACGTVRFTQRKVELLRCGVLRAEMARCAICWQMAVEAIGCYGAAKPYPA